MKVSGGNESPHSDLRVGRAKESSSKRKRENKIKTGHMKCGITAKMWKVTTYKRWKSGRMFALHCWSNSVSSSVPLSSPTVLPR